MVDKINNNSQVAKCPSCKNANYSKRLLCNACSNDPFKIEALREYLARNKDYRNFKLSYGKEYAEIKNLNTKNFWDDKFSLPSKLSLQDKMTQEKIDTIISFFPKKKSLILDLGIGQGYVEQRLLSLNIYHDVCGVDISSEAVERAKKNSKGNFVVGDVLEIEKNYKKNYFDVVMAVELIEHISPSKIFKFYKMVHSVLKDGGIFIISTPLNEGLRFGKENLSGHVREYSIPILKMEFQLSGFKVVNTKTLYAFNNLYKLKKLLTRIFPWRWEPNNVVVRAVKA